METTMMMMIKIMKMMMSAENSKLKEATMIRIRRKTMTSSLTTQGVHYHII